MARHDKQTCDRRVHCGEREGRSDYVAKNNLPPRNASGKEEARKRENSASTHNDPSECHGEPTDEELLANAFCQLTICQIPFASNHLQTVSWPESAHSSSGVKLELGCGSSLGAGVCLSRTVPIFVIHRKIEMLTNLPCLPWTCPGGESGQQSGHVDLYDIIISIVLLGRESTYLGCS